MGAITAPTASGLVGQEGHERSGAPSTSEESAKDGCSAGQVFSLLPPGKMATDGDAKATAQPAGAMEVRAAGVCSCPKRGS